MSPTSQKGNLLSMHVLVLVASAVIAISLVACKSGRQNEAEGGRTEAKGKVEATVGGVIGDDNMKANGQKDQDKGKVQKAVGKAEVKVSQ